MGTYQSQLNVKSRITRIVVGAGLIGITMAASGTLGYLALLPLLAIYPLMTGILGEDPIDGVVANWSGGYKDHCYRSSSRVALIAVGVGMISIVMVNPQSFASLGWISLISVYPIMAGLFGEDLFSVAFNTQGQVKSHQSEVHTPVVDIEHREATVLHHAFSHGHGSDHKAA